MERMREMMEHDTSYSRKTRQKQGRIVSFSFLLSLTERKMCNDDEI